MYHESTVKSPDDNRTPDDITTDELLAALYGELRGVARHRLSHLPPGQTLSPTALVHEVWLRIQRNPEVEFESRAQFFTVAGTLMRNILVDRAREKGAQRRGGDRQRVNLTSIDPDDSDDLGDFEVVHEALEKLETEDPRSAKLVMLRFFAGMTLAEAAEALEISERTARRDWTFARVWLYDVLNTGPSGGEA